MLSLPGASSGDADEAYVAAHNARQQWKEQLPSQPGNVFEPAAAIVLDRKK
ncbi:hypothetical protein [Neolewinella xylanilytica]|uniref:hypothetical protein n=1 Tax=Neolewinella xylanilytica TaxID=1514080 RepID=UPI001473DC0E|nr:hypothetical protein [Neolewinella xylanilytica]